ncbi:MAG: hypothetical protein A2284_08915 [Deltaproteobacteria bacterium RIFOXYA12_FULL_61_11]|nr:MAG: hypothetical protein A2284_08915 [Deltaproteobacteria bacterium RIFOXYA12_FULL_61_11]
MAKLLVVTMFLGWIASAAPAGYVVRLLEDSTTEPEVIEVRDLPDQRRLAATDLEPWPLFLAEDRPLQGPWVREVVVDDPRPYLALLDQSEPLEEPHEVRTLVDQGPLANRIDLVIIGDGYLEEEKERFFGDAERIVEGLFGQSTFASYRPLFNVHAVFYPSKTSGIGDGSPKDTAFRLYRDSTARQAIYLGNTSMANKVLALAPQCDYPIVVANDPLYGGLGGQYAITTNSLQSAMIVLRHELGHNFGKVGEEYDGGQAYFGANHSASTTVSWLHWWTAQQTVSTASLHHLAAPWKNLLEGPYQVTFEHKAEQPRRYLLDFNTTGTATPKDLRLELDGRVVTYAGIFSTDRNFYRVFLPGELRGGTHRLSFTEGVPDGDNILAKVHLHGLPPGYATDPPSIGAYATYRAGGSLVGYRPTHATCLMRDMLSDSFCPVCIENIWLKFLAKVSLIDALDTSTAPGGHEVRLRTPDLCGCGTGGKAVLKVRWLREGSQVPAFDDEKVVRIPTELGGKWRVEVRFLTPEIRQDPKNLTLDGADFSL